MLKNIYIEYVKETLLTSSGKINARKANKVFLRKDNPEFLKYLENKELRFSESIFLLMNNLSEKPICPICKEKHIPFRSFAFGYRQTCGPGCSNKLEIRQEKRKETCLKKYGVTHYCKSEEFKERYRMEIYPSIDQEKAEQSRKKTKIQMYGDSEFRNHQKRKRTCLERYGFENFTETSKFKKSVRFRNHSYFYFKENDKLISLHTVEDIMKGSPKRFQCKECGEIFEPKECWNGKNNVIRCVLCRAKELDRMRNNINIVIDRILSMKNVDFSFLTNKLNIKFSTGA